MSTTTEADDPNEMEPTELVELLQSFVEDHEGEEWSVNEIYEVFGWEIEDFENHTEYRHQFFGVISTVDLLWYTDSGVNPRALDEGAWYFEEE